MLSKSYLLYEKGLKLDAMGTNADGAGIGTSFLGFEINDRVPEESIPKYAKGFFVASGVVLVVGLAILIQPLIKKIMPQR